MHCNEILRVYVNRKHRFSYNKIYTGLGGKEPEIPCQIYILKETETESMARGTSIAMPDSACHHSNVLSMYQQYAKEIIM